MSKSYAKPYYCHFYDISTCFEGKTIRNSDKLSLSEEMRYNEKGSPRIGATPVINYYPKTICSPFRT